MKIVLGWFGLLFDFGRGVYGNDDDVYSYYFQFPKFRTPNDQWAFVPASKESYYAMGLDCERHSE